jgi:hypothetical protein
MSQHVLAPVSEEEIFFGWTFSVQYFFRGLYFANGVCKLNLDFKPKDMPVDVYNDPDRFHQWLVQTRFGSTPPQEPARPGPLKRFWRAISHPFRQTPKGSGAGILRDDGGDVVVRVSAPYIDLTIPD